ncbi:MAG: HAD family hydrolase [Erysipelotrichaceae bacterium]
MKYKAILYDLDGTLLNTTDMNILPLQQLILRHTNKLYDYKDLVSYTSLNGHKILEKLGLYPIDEIYAEWVNDIQLSNLKATMYPNVYETISAIDKFNIIQGVVSSKYIKQYSIDIADTNLDPFFKIKVLKEHTTKHKPDPDPLLLALKLLNLKANEVLYVGDTTVDIEACKAVNMDVAYVEWGPINISNPVGATYILKDLKDLLKIIEA